MACSKPNSPPGERELVPDPEGMCRGDLGVRLIYLVMYKESEQSGFIEFYVGVTLHVAASAS